MVDETTAPEDIQEEVLEDEKTVLKRRADLMGIKYHPSIGLEKLKEKVNGALTNEGVDEDAEFDDGKEEDQQAETESQRRARKKREAERLIRIEVTCMDPKKTDYEGDIITAGNSLLGSYRKYVAFGQPWHVPEIIYKQLKNAKCQVFSTVTTEQAGKKVQVRRGRLINAFAINVLDPLTQKELDDLAKQQAMAGRIEA